MKAASDLAHSNGVEIDDAVRAFDRISQELLTGYQALARRAEHVEQELGRTNLELADRLAELDQVKRDLEAILESLPAGVIVRDARGLIVRVNDAAARILGKPGAELLGQSALPGLPCLPREKAGWSEARIERVDGGRVVLARHSSTVCSPDGRTSGSVEILDDRTELVQVTERMQLQEKMAALGTMAGGIAHEIRNPLNAVKGFASLLARELEPGGKLARWAGRIQDGVNEVDAIIASLLSFAQPDRSHLELVALPELVTAAVELAYRGREQERWPLSVDCPELSLPADRIQLRQALRNLVANAIDAQPRGGRIHIAVQRSGAEVSIAVSDAGPGISPELAAKVIEPFFTTRAEGTGLGLAIVHTIVRLHGGRLEIAPESSSLGGATIRIRLPLANRS